MPIPFPSDARRQQLCEAAAVAAVDFVRLRLLGEPDDIEGSDTPCDIAWSLAEAHGDLARYLEQHAAVPIERLTPDEASAAGKALEAARNSALVEIAEAAVMFGLQLAAVLHANPLAPVPRRPAAKRT